MEICRGILLVVMWGLIVGFGCNIVLQKICYSFYKSAHHIESIETTPEKIQFTDRLSGYGCNLDKESDMVVLFFGGSGYIAYNSVGKYGGRFSCPFLAADFYGTQDSKGRMKLKTMQQTATDFYDCIQERYPGKKIVVMGHSYGSGFAAYLASVRKCDALFIVAGYRDVADLYNQIILIFKGTVRILISEDIAVKEYAKNVTCDTYIIGSKSDKTLPEKLQVKLKECFEHAKLKIFDKVKHEDYMENEEVIDYINKEICEM